mmetsp:Transcript_11119/g.20610  ORF Transcript_11119/g.20610 Transcript_11119/m.20610 type:complete len:955 (+) Transcript_11119:141-3005(+)
MRNGNEPQRCRGANEPGALGNLVSCCSTPILFRSVKIARAGPCLFRLLALVVVEEGVGAHAHELTSLVALQGLHKELDELRLRQERDAEVDGRAADVEVVLRLRAAVGGQVHHQVDGLVPQQRLHVGLHRGLVGEVDERGGHVVGLEKLVRFFRRHQAVAHLVEAPRGVHHLVLQALVEAQQDVLLRELEAGGEEGFQEGLVLVGPEARHLPRRRHLHPQHGVGAPEARKREHGRLAAHVARGPVPLPQVGQVHVVDGLAHHDFCGGFNKVHPHGLAHKGERAAGAQVALNHQHVGALGDELHVAGPRDVQLFRDLARHLFDAAKRVVRDVLRREEQGRVPRVHSRVLNVLVHRRRHHLAPAAHGVHLDLPRPLNELRHHHGLVRGHVLRQAQERPQLLRGVRHVHGRAAQHVAGAHQHGVAHALGELKRRVHVGELPPRGLLHPDLVEHGGKLEAVFGAVDHFRGSAQNLHPGVRERHGQVLRDLPPHAHNHAVDAFLVVNVHHPLPGELLKVELVALVVVRADRFGVVVDHHRALAHGTQGANRGHRAPVELHRGPDAVRAVAEHHHPAFLPSLDVALHGVVRAVQVVGLRWVLGCEGVDLLHEGGHAHAFALGAHLVFGWRPHQQTRELRVREAVLLGRQHLVPRDAFEGQGLELRGVDGDAVQALQEPVVNVGEVVQVFHRVRAGVQPLRDRKDAAVARVLQLLVHVVSELVRVLAPRLKPRNRGVHHAHGLLHRLLPRAPNGHHLPHRLHGRADLRGHPFELGQVPSRDLRHHVVQARLEARLRHFGHRVLHFRQLHAQAQLRRHERQRVARGLGGQRRGAAEARVHLDDAVLERPRVERVLDVALADDAQVPNHLDGGGPELEVLAVAQGLGRGHHDGVARVHPQRVEVFHVAHRDAVVPGVPNHFVLDLLPPAKVLVDQDLVRHAERLLRQVLELHLVVRKTRPEPP